MCPRGSRASNKSFHLCMPQFPHLQREDSESPAPLGPRLLPQALLADAEGCVQWPSFRKLPWSRPRELRRGCSLISPSVCPSPPAKGSSGGTPPPSQKPPIHALGGAGRAGRWWWGHHGHTRLFPAFNRITGLGLPSV